jgi:xylan 1,4-beta-xylosidase
VWHYHDDAVDGPPADVTVTLRNLPQTLPDRPMQVREYRIDDRHSNAFEAWRSMGSPQQPTPQQYAQLQHAGMLAAMNDPAPVTHNQGAATFRIRLPRQSVSLLVFTW